MQAPVTSRQWDAVRSRRADREVVSATSQPTRIVRVVAEREGSRLVRPVAEVTVNKPGALYYALRRFVES